MTNKYIHVLVTVYSQQYKLDEVRWGQIQRQRETDRHRETDRERERYTLYFLVCARQKLERTRVRYHRHRGQSFRGKL